jgi:hypothetical protein
MFELAAAIVTMFDKNRDTTAAGGGGSGGNKEKLLELYKKVDCLLVRASNLAQRVHVKINNNRKTNHERR